MYLHSLYMHSWRVQKRFGFFIMFSFWARQPPSGPGPPHLRGFQITQNDAPQSVGLLWAGDQPDAQTTIWQHTTLTTDRTPCLRWDSNPQSQQASGRRPTPYTVRPLGPAFFNHSSFYISLYVNYSHFIWKICQVKEHLVGKVRRFGHLMGTAQ